MTSQTGESIVQQALALSPADRVQVLQRLWESLPLDSGDLLLTSELLEELDRRVAKEDAHPDDDFTWDEVKAGVPRQP